MLFRLASVVFRLTSVLFRLTRMACLTPGPCKPFLFLSTSCHLSMAAARSSSKVLYPPACFSFPTIRLHIVCGLPRLLFPSGPHVMAVKQSPLVSFLWIWPAACLIAHVLHPAFSSHSECAVAIVSSTSSVDIRFERHPVSSHLLSSSSNSRTHSSKRSLPGLEQHQFGVLGDVA